MSTPPGPPPPELPGNATTSGTPPAPELQWRMKSFEFVADGAKQLITVGTGVITISAVFSKDLDVISRRWALAAWIALIVSVFFGILTLWNMAGMMAVLGKPRQEGEEKSEEFKAAENEGINDGGNRFLSSAQLGLFAIGLVLMLFFGYFAVQRSGDKYPVKAQQNSAKTNCGNQNKDNATSPSVTVNCISSAPSFPAHTLRQETDRKCEKEIQGKEK